MNDMQQLIRFFTIIGFILVVYFSRFILRNYPKSTSEEIEKINPDLRGIKYKYNLFQVGIFLGSGALIVWLLPNKSNPIQIIVFPLAIAFLLYDSIFALITGVHGATSRHNWNQFVYDAEGELSWVAYLQILLALLLAGIGIFLFLFFRE